MENILDWVLSDEMLEQRWLLSDFDKILFIQFLLLFAKEFEIFSKDPEEKLLSMPSMMDLEPASFQVCQASPWYSDVMAIV